MENKIYNMTTTVNEKNGLDFVIDETKYFIKNIDRLTEIERRMVTDAETGEVLFVAEHGNILYIEGSFAKKLFKP